MTTDTIVYDKNSTVTGIALLENGNPEELEIITGSQAISGNVYLGKISKKVMLAGDKEGFFVNLGNGLSGLVHISQISEKRIKHPSAVLAVGDKVKVKVIAVKDGKLSLSMKALQDVAAQEIEEEVYELPETEEATTTLGSLFANIKLS